MSGDEQTLVIYTDGGCHGNPGPGGWAFVIQHQNSIVSGSGAESYTTNNRMELRAVIEALKKASELISQRGGAGGCDADLFTDSQYVRGGISDWISRWKRNGWKTSAGKPVKNQELWRELAEWAQDIEIRWHWVKGHAGNERNELCDSLVQEAIATLRSS